MSIDDLDAAFQAAEAELRAYYTKTRDSHRTMAANDPDGETVPESGWTVTERETLEELRAHAVDAAMSLLAARDWSSPDEEAARCSDCEDVSGTTRGPGPCSS